MRGVGLIVGLLLGASACASDVPRPTELDAARVRSRWADVSVEALAEGRRLYVGHCASCHRPLAPASRTTLEWRRSIADMRVRAGLDPLQVERVLRYLDAFARDTQVP